MRTAKYCTKAHDQAFWIPAGRAPGPELPGTDTCRDRDHSSRALQDVLAKPPGPFQWDARVRHKDGNYSWVESTVSNLLSELEVQAMVVHQRNIEARRAAEVESLR